MSAKTTLALWMLAFWKLFRFEKEGDGMLKETNGNTTVDARGPKWLQTMIPSAQPVGTLVKNLGVGPNGETVSIVRLNCVAAKKLLEHPDNFKDGEVLNRTLRKGAVERLRRLMKRNAFGLGTDGIGRSKSGRVLNAFHRLTALSGMPEDYYAYFLFLEGCPEDMMLFLDDGVKRTDADRDRIAHPERKHHTERQGIMSTLFDLAVSQHDDPAFIEKDALYEKNAENVEYVIANVNRKSTGATCGVLSGMTFALGTTYRDKVLSFVSQFASGVGVESVNAPAVTLIRFLLSLEKGHGFSAIELAQMTLYAIKRHCETGGKPSKAIVLGGRGDKKNREKYANAVEFFRTARTIRNPRTK